MNQQYKILCLECNGKVTMFKSTSKDLQDKYSISNDLATRLLRGEVLTILHSSYKYFPIGSKVTINKVESLKSKIKRLLTTKVKYLFTR